MCFSFFEYPISLLVTSIFLIELISMVILLLSGVRDVIWFATCPSRVRRKGGHRRQDSSAKRDT